MADLPSVDPIAQVTKLPDEGLVHVLSKAADQYPILALVLVLVFLAVAAGIIGTVIVAGLRYRALQNPDAAAALRGMKQDEKLFKLALKKMKQEARDKRRSTNRRVARA
jgi:hypothetical protein